MHTKVPCVVFLKQLTLVEGYWYVTQQGHDKYFFSQSINFKYTWSHQKIRLKRVVGASESVDDIGLIKLGIKSDHNKWNGHDIVTRQTQ